MIETIDISQNGPHVRIRKGGVEELLMDVRYSRVVAAYGKALANARVYFNPRWLTYSGPNLDEAAFDRMIHRILFQRLQFYASTHKRLTIPVNDFDIPETRAEVRRAVEEQYPAGSEEAEGLTAHLLGMTTGRYREWRETEPAR